MMRRVGFVTTNGKKTMNEKLSALRYNLKQIVKENNGDGRHDVGRDPRTVSRASECLRIVDELEESISDTREDTDENST